MNNHKILPLLILLLFDVDGDLLISINYQPSVRSQIIDFIENLEVYKKCRCPHLRQDFIVLQGDILFAVGDNSTNICCKFLFQFLKFSFCIFQISISLLLNGRCEFGLSTLFWILQILSWIALWKELSSVPYRAMKQMQHNRFLPFHFHLRIFRLPKYSVLRSSSSFLETHIKY